MSQEPSQRPSGVATSHVDLQHRTRSGLRSVLWGRPLQALGGVVTLLLLSRSLSAAEYAAYFALWAAIEIVVLASNMGLMHAAYRYVQARPAAEGPGLTVHGPLGRLLALRAISLPMGVVTGFLLVPSMSSASTASVDAAHLLTAFAVITLAEGLVRYVEVCFESLMLQPLAQRTMLLRSVLKPLLIAGLMLTGPLHLDKVLWVECLSVLAACAWALVSLLRLRARSRLVPNRSAAGEALSLRRMLAFVAPAFMTQLLGICFGPDVLKLLMSAGPDLAALAVFGFAFSLAAMVQRYLPVNILGGLFRPLFVESAGLCDGGAGSARLFSVLVKLNVLVLAVPLMVLSPIAVQFASVLSSGNYPAAGPVLLVLLLGSLFLSVHGVLSMHCLALEQARAPLLATVAAVATLPLSLWMSGRWGASGMAAGWCVSEAVWVSVCWIALGKTGRPRVNLGGLVKLPAFTGALVGVSVAVAWWSSHLAAPLALMNIVALVMLVRRGQVFDGDERAWFAGVAPLRLQSIFKKVFT